MTAAHPCSEKGVRPCRPDAAAPLACDRHGGRSPVHETRPSSSSCAPCKANGEVCADNDTCCSNICNAFKYAGPNSIEALKLCTANAACISGDCVTGFCAQVCGDGSCDGIERCRDKNSGVECLSDCGRCPNGDVCIDGADRSTGPVATGGPSRKVRPETTRKTQHFMAQPRSGCTRILSLISPRWYVAIKEPGMSLTRKSFLTGSLAVGALAVLDGCGFPQSHRRDSAG